MGTTADKLNKILSTKNDIKEAIENKGVIVGNTAFANYDDKISLIGSDTSFIVRILDYDGTILKKIIAKQGDNVLSSLPTMSDKPATNIRPALTYQGLNHIDTSFTSVQNDIDAGAMYVPSDGKTHLYLRVLPAASSYAIPLCITKGDTTLMTIDWGDGNTSTSSASGEVKFSAPYTAPGFYHVTITNGNYILGNSSNSLLGNVQEQKDCLYACYVGTGVTRLYSGCFNNCKAKFITIPNGITVTSSDLNVFRFTCIKHISIPRSITRLYTFSLGQCTFLKSISLPDNYSYLDVSMFNSDYALTSIIIPSGCTVIQSSCFSGCKSLKTIKTPSGVTYLGTSCFNGCSALENITIKSTTLTTLGNDIFNGCSKLTTINMTNPLLMLPNSTMFSSCFCLNDGIQVPSGTTSIVSYTFYNNTNRTYFDIPSSVSSIADNAFAYCYGLKYMIIRPTTPPTLSNINAFASIASSVPFYVPDASVSAYQTATNWVTYANQIRPLSEFNVNNF